MVHKNRHIKGKSICVLLKFVRDGDHLWAELPSLSETLRNREAQIALL